MVRINRLILTIFLFDFMLHQIIKMFYTCILELSTLILIYNIIKIILILDLSIVQYVFLNNYQFKIQFWYYQFNLVLGRNLTPYFSEIIIYT